MGNVRYVLRRSRNNSLQVIYESILSKNTADDETTPDNYCTTIDDATEAARDGQHVDIGHKQLVYMYEFYERQTKCVARHLLHRAIRRLGYYLVAGRHTIGRELPSLNMQYKNNKLYPHVARCNIEATRG